MAIPDIEIIFLNVHVHFFIASQYIPECKTHLLNTPVIRLVSLQIQKKREDLRLIVTSATLNAEVWTTYSAYLSLPLPILWNH